MHMQSQTLQCVIHASARKNTYLAETCFFFLIIYPGKCFISVYVHLLYSFNCYSSINKLTMSGPTGCFQYCIIPFILQETSLHVC